MRGYDGAKKVNGRKRHLLVDTTNGLVMKVKVHSADLAEREGARVLLWSESVNLSRVLGTCCGRMPDIEERS